MRYMLVFDFENISLASRWNGANVSSMPTTTHNHRGVLPLPRILATSLHASGPTPLRCRNTHREPQLHAIAQQFESTYEPGEARAAVIADALRVW